MSRGSGQTTHQLITAPQKAYFVAPSPQAVSYTKALAQHLKREDLRIESPAFLDQDCQRLRGIQYAVILDHATIEHLSRRSFEAFCQWHTSYGYRLLQQSDNKEMPNG